MSFWDKVVAFFKTNYAKASAGFVSMFGKDAAEEFAHGAEALLKTGLGIIATDAVMASSSLVRNPNGSPATSTDKRNAAFQKIAVDAKSQGINVTSSIANLLIELAVQKVVANNVISNIK